MISEMPFIIIAILFCVGVTVLLGKGVDRKDCPQWHVVAFIFMLGQTLSMICFFIYGCIKLMIR